SASSDRNKFYMGVGFITDEGVVKHEKLQRVNLNLSDEYKISKTFKVGFNVSAT
ncbi:MAG TPA: hypothetical protein DIW54_12220, partial [Chitinophagaceae bacterium]|nr:hypothetical protein [Chitinophagaceae bacterium]